MWPQFVSPETFGLVIASMFIGLGLGAMILILGGVTAVLISIIWSFATPRLRAVTPPGPRWRWVRPIVGAIVGAFYAFLTYWTGAGLAAVEAGLNGTLILGTMPLFTYWEVALLAVGALFGAAVARYHWHGAGILGYVGLLTMIGGYIAYALVVTIPLVPPDERWISYFLLAAESGGLGLIAVFSFYTLDASTRRRWTRGPNQTPYDPDHRPTVAFEVPVFNEPPEMVEQTVAHLVRQDYPKDRFCVVVADDSTDAEIRKKNAEMCKRLGAHHVTRTKRTGYKAGALNHVNRLLDDEIELVAIIDADYWVSPDYLRSIVGFFVDPGLSFVQTPQDYRNIDESFLTRRYKQAEAYFYHGIMPSRNEENTIIFCGTMGMIRRESIDAVGGFAEDQICEDAELSVRLAADGWRSLYIDKTFGRGLMPAIFEAYKKQFHRWAFGNVKILLSRTGLILRSKMTARQKVDYLVSNLHWFDGFFVAAIALILLYLGMGPVIGYDAVSHHQRELALLGIVPVVLIADSVFRLHYVLRKDGKIGLKDTILVQGMWFAIKMTNVRAVTKAMLGFKAPFVRTPKSPEHSLSVPGAFFRSLRLTKVESVMGGLLLAAAVVNFQPQVLAGRGAFGFLLPTWLLLYSLFFLSAPIYAYLSYRTLRPIGEDTTTTVVPKPVRSRGRVVRSAARRAHPTGRRPTVTMRASRSHRPLGHAEVRLRSAGGGTGSHVVARRPVLQAAPHVARR